MVYSRAQKELIYQFTHAPTDIEQLKFDFGVLPELIAILGETAAKAEFAVLVDLFLTNLNVRLIEFELAYANQNWNVLFQLCHNFRVLTSLEHGNP